MLAKNTFAVNAIQSLMLEKNIGNLKGYGMTNLWFLRFVTSVKDFVLKRIETGMIASPLNVYMKQSAVNLRRKYVELSPCNNRKSSKTG